MTAENVLLCFRVWFWPNTEMLAKAELNFFIVILMLHILIIHFKPPASPIPNLSDA